MNYNQPGSAWRVLAATLLPVLFLVLVGCTVLDQNPTTGREGGRPAENEPGVAEHGLITARVKEVVDGDTVRVILEKGGEEKVRLIGVDTPESTGEVEPFGREASEFTREKLEGRQVWLELDVEERDRYGRLLAYLWTQKPRVDAVKDETVRKGMFNAELLLSGYARVMTVPPNVKYADYFVNYQREAREETRGLWGLPGESAQPEQYYVASARSNKYHRPDCRWGKQISPANLVRFDTVDAALDTGYQPCRACKP